MKNLFRTLSILLLLFPSRGVFAQVKKAVAALQVGEQCPDFNFTNIINYKATNTKLSAFKGKIVILDFWATWCGSCIQALPDLDKVQKEIPDSLVILPVTYEKPEKAKKFWSINSNLNVLSLPSITADTTLEKAFPHRMIPHEVWIGPTGKVMAITGSEDITVRNVRLALTQGRYPGKVKKDFTKIVYNKPLYAGYFGEEQLSPGLIQYQSMLTRNVDGAPGNYTITKPTPLLVKRTLTNWTITNLYHVATLHTGLMSNYKGDFSEHLRSMVILDVKDSSMFDWPTITSEQWAKKPDSLKVFCYEQIVPLADSANLNNYMLQDLNRYFGKLLGIEGRMEKRKVKCWALVKTGTGSIPISRGGKPEMTFGLNEDYCSVRNTTIREWFVSMLRGGPLENSPLPVINESGVTEPVDFEIHGDLKNPRAIGDALHKYGLDFRLEERELDMMVISDNR